jgi:TfoX/Sxy family transcriptional regulator of competence genes
MAFDEKLAAKLREIFNKTGQSTEKRMFGGIAFMLNGNMCCGVINDLLMARVGRDRYEASLALPHVRPMDFTGKPMTGYVYVEPEDVDLKVWVDRCVDFVSTLPGK